MYPCGTMQPLDAVPAKSVPLTLVMLLVTAAWP